MRDGSTKAESRKGWWWWGGSDGCMWRMERVVEE